MGDESRIDIIVKNPVYQELCATLINENGGILYVAETDSTPFPDGSPNLTIGMEGRVGEDRSPYANIVVIPGYISGPNTVPNLNLMVQIGHTFSREIRTDHRTPWAQAIIYVLSDLEGRGNKPTKNENGDGLIPEAQLQPAYYTIDMLTYTGKANKVILLDPHDFDTVRLFEEKGVSVTSITALHECAKYMADQGLIPDTEASNEKKKKYGIFIPDNGSIGRCLKLSKLTGIPIVGRIYKTRNGTNIKITVTGAENIIGKHILLPDDMIASGNTLYTDAKWLRDNGAASVTAIVIHVKGVPKAQNTLFRCFTEQCKDGKSVLNNIVITNSTPYHKQLLDLNRQIDEQRSVIHAVNVLPLMAHVTRAVLYPTKKIWRPSDMIYLLSAPMNNI